MGSHKTYVCVCGKIISTCRCNSPAKEIVVSDKPCQHPKGKQSHTPEGSNHPSVAQKSIYVQTLYKELEETQRQLEDARRRERQLLSLFGIQPSAYDTTAVKWEETVALWKQAQMRIGIQKFALDFADELDAQATSGPTKDIANELRERATKIGGVQR